MHKRKVMELVEQIVIAVNVIHSVYSYSRELLHQAL